jgi:hypothetical protein
LAYWLNLYNLTIFTEFNRQYPITNLKSAMEGGFLDKKQFTIEGQSLSLNDIQTTAYEGDTVWKMLEVNAN